MRIYSMREKETWEKSFGRGKSRNDSMLSKCFNYGNVLSGLHFPRDSVKVRTIVITTANENVH